MLFCQFYIKVLIILKNISYLLKMSEISAKGNYKSCKPFVLIGN